jgi:predicted phosphoadenosine phosphosulfate sulfurtransferase
MKVYEQDTTVLEKAKERIRFFINRFENIVVGVSGGKDSGVVFNLVKDVAREMGELPIYALWIDQEAEYAATVDMIEYWMTQDGVIPMWLQMPMKITNATSNTPDFLHCWNPELDEDEWMRPKHEVAMTENTYGTDRFSDLFSAILLEEFDAPTAMLAGMQAQESPRRRLAVTDSNTWNGITYGTFHGNSRGDHYTFYPIYDWKYSDVWKYTHDNDLRYNDIYDKMYKKGLSVTNMRVSNLHHEQSMQSLFRLQEFEPETYNKLVDRIGGIHTAGQMGDDNYFPDDLPHMFADWREYRNYLLHNIVDKEEHVKRFQRHFLTMDLRAEHDEERYEGMLKTHVRGILANDWEGESTLKSASAKVENDPWASIMQWKKQWLKDEGIWQEMVEDGIVRNE